VRQYGESVPVPEFAHEPVMVAEVVDAFAPEKASAK